MGLQGVSAQRPGGGAAPTRVTFTFRPDPGVTPGGVVTHQRQGGEDMASFRAALDAQAALRGLVLPTYWLHDNVIKNPGTVAVIVSATEPAVWPEDEVEP